MESKKKYYKYLDIIRIVSCIAVFLYHLGLLKGGYLAVCSFFVLSGYLSYVSASKKEKFSFLSYYKERFIHIYIPYILVIFISIAIIHFIPMIHWFNLKPETTSALLGYNNFWQLNANLDYFARHVDSPFMHFWYMGILLQFELVFPFLYLIIHTISKKSRKIPCILLGILTIASMSYFGYQSIVEENRMIVYYHTLTRVFSLLLGIWIGFIHSHYHSLIIKKWDSRVFFYFYLLLFILGCIFISADSTFFMVGMIMTSIITARLISYGTSTLSNSLSKIDKVSQYLAKISYEIYLIQYPVIFLFQYVVLKDMMKVPVIILITIVLSMILHFIFSGKKRFLQVFLLGIFLLGSLFGGYQYVIAEDHTKEMKLLEEQLNENEKMMANKQEEYAKKMKEEEEELKKVLEEIENNQQGLGEYIHNLPVIGVGDSVMLGAFSSLYQQFPKGYFDAKVSRTDYEANKILQDIKYQGFLGDPIVIGLGTNGQCGVRCQEVILQTVEDRKVFWINVVNDKDVHVNAGLQRLADSHENVTLIDWASISSGHYEYFVADGIHLTGSGREAYAQAVYDAIYKVYEDEIQAKKEKVMKEHEENLNKKISFYGNDILLKSYSFFQNEFQDYELDFHAKQGQTVEEIVKDIKDVSKSNAFPKHIVIILDSSMNLTKEQYQELQQLPTHTYIVSMKAISYSNSDTITVIDFSKEIKSHSEYLMVDGVHLTEDGNDALSKQLASIIKQ